MAFFTRSKTVTADEEDLSEDEWDDLEERRTPDGRSSKTSFELRRDLTIPNLEEEKEVVECKNPCIPEACYTNATELQITEESNDAKTEDRYEFVVDRVLGVQV